MRHLIILGLFLLLGDPSARVQAGPMVFAAPQSAAELTAQARAKEKAGDVDGAIADYTRAIDLDPKDGTTYGLRGLAKKAKGDCPGAIADYSRALELDPKNAAAFFNRGSARVDLRVYGEAIQDFSRAIELDPQNSHLYHFRGCAFYDARFFGSAVTDFKKSIDLEAGAWEFPRLRLWLARAKMGDRGEATEDFKKYLARRTPPQGTDYLGKAAHFLTDELTADAFIDSVESDLTEGSRRWRCQAYFLLGERSVLNGDKPSAARHFERALATKATAWRDYQSAEVALDRLRAEKK
jgi:tetratricopeptide (TPR) repeat protein